MHRSALLMATILLGLPAAASAGAPLLPYDTCNKGMAPPKCMCSDMPMVENNWYVNLKARDTWQSIKDARPASIAAAEASFAAANVKDSVLTGRMAPCDSSSQLVLGLSNFYRPIYNSCYCEKTCDVMVNSTKTHEDTHGEDRVQDMEYLILLGTSPKGQSSLIFNRDKIFGIVRAQGEVHAHDEQAKYEMDQMQAYITQGCTWTPVTNPYPPPPPPPKGFIPRVKALAQRLIDRPQRPPPPLRPQVPLAK